MVVRTEPLEGAEVKPAPVRRDRWKGLFVILLIVGLLGAAAWVLLGSRLLVVRQVEISGLDLLSRPKVLAAAGVPIGTPLARLDTAQVRARVAALREVESVEVERGWPTTLRIVVHERVPVAVVQRAGEYNQLDVHGVTVITSRSQPSTLPLLVTPTPGASDKTTLAALAVLKSLPPRLTKRLFTVEALSPEAVTLRLSGGIALVWGAPERSSEKLRVFDALMATKAGRAARTIDVSAPGIVTTR
jgi:cell division protein FtsQ